HLAHQLVELRQRRGLLYADKKQTHYVLRRGRINERARSEFCFRLGKLHPAELQIDAWSLHPTLRRRFEELAGAVIMIKRAFIEAERRDERQIVRAANIRRDQRELRAVAVAAQTIGLALDAPYFRWRGVAQLKRRRIGEGGFFIEAQLDVFMSRVTDVRAQHHLHFPVADAEALLEDVF